jgi:hypothetical protein
VTDTPYVQALRDTVAARLARAVAADPGTDPIAHRLDEYRACIAELDAWLTDIDDDDRQESEG